MKPSSPFRQPANPGMASPLPPPTIPWRQQGLTLVPGLVLTAAIAAIAIGGSRLLGVHSLNPLLIAVVLGLAGRQVFPIPPHYHPGIQFSMKRILRLAVILLGLRLSLAELLAVGPTGLGIVAVSSVSTFILTCWLGRRLRLGQRLTLLIAAGTSICGASAVIATNAVVDSSEEDVAYAIALVTVLGTLAMIFYPLLPNLLSLSPSAFGMWCGASIHEVAQVVAAAFQQGTTSGDLATITKLSRVLLLIPLVALLGWQAPTQISPASQRRLAIPVPWFVLLFGLVVLANSTPLIPTGIRQGLIGLNQGLMCMAMAAMGLETRLQKITQVGIKPLCLAGASWLFLASLSLGLIKLQARL